MGQAIAVRTDFLRLARFAGLPSGRRMRRRRADCWRSRSRARRRFAGSRCQDRWDGSSCRTLRDWVHRFNEQGPDGLINIPSPGVPPKLGKEAPGISGPAG